MSLEEFSVRWRRAVVTGAGKDIDRSICLALAEADADVLAFSHNADDLATLRDEIYALGALCRHRRRRVQPRRCPGQHRCKHAFKMGMSDQAEFDADVRRIRHDLEGLFGHHDGRRASTEHGGGGAVSR